MRDALIFSFFLVIFVAVGGGILHELRQGYQLAELRGVRRGVQQCEQLAVDAVYREGPGEPHVYRDQIHDPRLLVVPRERSQL